MPRHVYCVVEAKLIGAVFCQLIDVGKKIIAHRVHGFLPTQIMTFVTNLHVAPRPIWLTRHGERIYNTKVRAGRAVAPVTGL